MRVGVDVVTIGSDQGQLEPMVDPVEARCGRSPEQWLVDGGYPGHGQLDAVAERTEALAPVPKAKVSQHDQAEGAPAETTDPHTPKAGDSPAVPTWRERMGTEDAKTRYQDRAATAECINAQARNRGLQRLPVRGLDKVKGVATLFALAHNLMRMIALLPEWFGLGAAAFATPGMAG